MQIDALPWLRRALTHNRTQVATQSHSLKPKSQTALCSTNSTTGTLTYVCSGETKKMDRLNLPEDPSKDKAVEMRRAAEAIRRTRIFNAQLRVMGVSTNALNQQVEQKKQLQEMEKRRDQAYDKMRKYHDDLLLQQDLNAELQRKVLHHDLTQYWATQQRAEDSREADLNCGLKGAFSITLPESELGPASMQIFQGEGIGEDQKRREDMKKAEKDLRAQAEHNERRNMRDKYRETLMDKELVCQDLRGVQLQALEARCRRAARIALDNYNQALAAEQVENRKELQRREESENRSEILHTLTSDMMTERAEAAERAAGGGRPPRVLIGRWKGMSTEQLKDIHREREEQCREKQRQRDAEKLRDAAWDLKLLKLSRDADEEQRRAEQLRREKRVQTDHLNSLMAKEQQAYQEYLNKTLYTNKPTKDFFSQFNTSSR